MDLSLNKGPLLFLHGTYTDGIAWFSGDPALPSLPRRFFEEGYDVWFWNRRGTTHSRGHTDPAITEEDYWAWNEKDIVEEDITAQIKYILESRSDCKKLSIVTTSRGTAEATLLLSEFPSASADYIAQVVNSAACWILGI